MKRWTYCVVESRQCAEVAQGLRTKQVAIRWILAHAKESGTLYWIERRKKAKRFDTKKHR